MEWCDEKQWCRWCVTFVVNVQLTVEADINMTKKFHGNWIVVEILVWTKVVDWLTKRQRLLLKKKKVQVLNICVCVFDILCSFICVYHIFHLHTLLTKLIWNFSIPCLKKKKKTVQGSHLLNDVAAGIHFVLTSVAEGGELGNKAGMCSGC